MGAIMKKGNTQGAIASTIVGVILVVLGFFGVNIPLAEITCIVASCLAYAVVSLLTQKKEA